LIPPPIQKSEYYQKLPQIQKYAKQAIIQDFGQMTERIFSPTQPQKAPNILDNFSEKYRDKALKIMDILDLEMDGILFPCQKIDEIDWETPASEECPF